jgi:hypothetical protein
MEIRIGRQTVSLDPVGTLLIGSKGRVDAVGTAGRAPLLLVNAKVKRAADLIKVNVVRVDGISNGGHLTPVPPAPPSSPKEPISWMWKIMNRSPSIRGGLSFVELDKESFFSLLMEIANG